MNAAAEGGGWLPLSAATHMEWINRFIASATRRQRSTTAALTGNVSRGKWGNLMRIAHARHEPTAREAAQRAH